ncbi:hypothetical protein [Oecophyllibacter saccharovorans]|uniref:hypothetical protein n=1 Tax=Oecophyllibacter saccharovorans TaxID=2558360 RepID=UPI0011685F56|nr:hypothetical protein [Oecophyllibacter saccharovorans]TPW36600.1 hypothetical protein E3203_02220 [Oecophyllibacter saccharovorans]
MSTRKTLNREKDLDQARIAEDSRYSGMDFSAGIDDATHKGDLHPEQDVEEGIASDSTKEGKGRGWAERRIGQLTAARRSAEEERDRHIEENRQLRAALAAARGMAPPAEEAPGQPEMSPEELLGFHAMAFRLAQAVRDAHGEEAIVPATQALQEKAGLDFDNPAHRELLADIGDHHRAGELYHALSRDPDAAAAIFDAPPRKQFALLAAFAEKAGLNAPKGHASAAPPPAEAGAGISNAPPPVDATPSGTGRAGKRSIYDESLSPEEYVAMRARKR